MWKTALNLTPDNLMDKWMRGAKKKPRSVYDLEMIYIVLDRNLEW